MNITTALVRLMLLAIAAFGTAMVVTPLFTHLLYRWRLRKNIRVTERAPLYMALHQAKAGVPTMGGVIVWGTVYLLAMGLFVATRLFPQIPFLRDLNFLSRSETYLVLASLLASAFVGLIDDIFNIFRYGEEGGGLRMRHRLLVYSLIASGGAYWFFYKLNWDLLHIPFFGDVNIGFWYLIIFVVVLVATSFSVNETDGLDGLAGGTLAIAFTAYGAIAFFQGRTDLAAFCVVIVGALIAYLWFNIPPARFIMGDTGAMSLGMTLGVVAMLTNQALLLLLIGFVFVAESASVMVQVASRTLFRRKVFLSTPLHHHFEAVGWPESKVVMRLWIIAVMVALFGVALAFIEPHSTLTGFLS